MGELPQSLLAKFIMRHARGHQKKLAAARSSEYITTIAAGKIHHAARTRQVIAKLLG